MQFQHTEYELLTVFKLKTKIHDLFLLSLSE